MQLQVKAKRSHSPGFSLELSRELWSWRQVGVGGELEQCTASAHKIVDPVRREAEPSDGETDGLMIVPEPVCLAFPECSITSTSQFSFLPFNTFEIGLCHLQPGIWIKTVPLKEEMENDWRMGTRAAPRGVEENGEGSRAITPEVPFSYCTRRILQHGTKAHTQHLQAERLPNPCLCALHIQPSVAKRSWQLPRQMNRTEIHSLSIYGAPSICQALKLTFAEDLNLIYFKGDVRYILG